MEKLKILFVCVENSFRSQIAEGLARGYFSDRIIAESAGSNPSGRVHPNAIKALQELGIDTKDMRSKGFDVLKEKRYDYMVTMGCGDTCPFYPAKRTIDWQLPDLKDAEFEQIRGLRDDIKNRISDLLKRHEEPSA